MSKHSFHDMYISGFEKCTFVMDDFGYLRPIHWGRVNHFLATLH